MTMVGGGGCCFVRYSGCLLCRCFFAELEASIARHQRPGKLLDLRECRSLDLDPAAHGGLGKPWTDAAAEHRRQEAMVVRA